jgi:hypothetical protein
MESNLLLIGRSVMKSIVILLKRSVHMDVIGISGAAGWMCVRFHLLACAASINKLFSHYCHAWPIESFF